MTWISLAILTVFTLAAAGCGGDSGRLGPDTPAPRAPMADETEVVPGDLTAPGIMPDEAANQREDTAIEEEDELAEERRHVEDSLLEADTSAGRSQADDGFAAQDEALRAAADFVPYVETGGHAEFDGSDVRVYLPIYNGGYPVVLNSVRDEVDGAATASRVAGYSQWYWTLFDNGPLAVVSVRWNDDDNGDYLAAGWWVREAFGRDTVESGAFVDGPELRGPLPDSMELPLSGQAVYYGLAAGLYQTQTRVHCTTFPCEIPSPDILVGEFTAGAKLVANFARGDIEGCVGCQEGIRFRPSAYDLDSGNIERGSVVTRDYLFWLHRTGFLESSYSKGTFGGDLSVVPLGGHAAGDGYWQGRFSNLADSSGNPRLLGATLHGQFEDRATQTSFTGVLNAESTAFGDTR